MFAGSPDVRRRRTVARGEERLAFARAGRRAPLTILQRVNRSVRPFQGRIRLGRQGVGTTMTLFQDVFTGGVFYFI